MILPAGKLIRRTIQPSFSQKGSSLLETMVALGVLGIIAGAVLSAVSTGSLSTSSLDGLVTGESLARTQMETIKNATYDPSGNYSPMSSPGFTISVNTTVISDDRQEITVFVKQEDKPLLTVTGYKIDR